MITLLEQKVHITHVLSLSHYIFTCPMCPSKPATVNVKLFQQFIVHILKLSVAADEIQNNLFRLYLLFFGVIKQVLYYSARFAQRRDQRWRDGRNFPQDFFSLFACGIHVRPRLCAHPSQRIT